PFVETPAPSEAEGPALSDVEGPALSDVEETVPSEGEAPAEEVAHAEPFADVADTRSVEEFTEAAPEPVVAFHAALEPAVDPVAEPPAEEPAPALVDDPEPPPVERRRPSILELFRATRPAKRAREAESDADTTSILRLPDPVSEPAVEAA